VVVTPSGTIVVTRSPGIGYDLDWERIERATVRKQEFIVS
jgi:L-alanine-DL-glutamate epimerase-like enolase superfamily enzyme